MSGHRIEFRIEPGGYPVMATVLCDEPLTAPCHLMCAEGCEDECHGNMETGLAHRTTSVAVCLAAEWLNNDGPVDCYGGLGRTRVRDGLIDVEWTGDNYGWDYTAVTE